MLTIDSGAPVPDQDLFDYIVFVVAALNYHGIVERYLRYRLSDDEAELLLARTDLQKFIDDQLKTCTSSKWAADFADALAARADAADDEEGLDLDTLVAWGKERGAEKFDTWFARLGDTRTRSFAVALAVLNGLPYDAVAQAARRLYHAFDLPPYMVMATAEDVQPEGLRSFRVSRCEWLQKLSARIAESETQGMYGPSVTEIVEYRNPDYALKVIRWAWSDYEAQDALLTWLGQLADDPSDQVRISVGLALGCLARWLFDFLCYNVLSLWATAGLAGGARQWLTLCGLWPLISACGLTFALWC